MRGRPSGTCSPSVGGPDPDPDPPQLEHLDQSSRASNVEPFSWYCDSFILRKQSSNWRDSSGNRKWKRKRNRKRKKKRKRSLSVTGDCSDADFGNATS